jgi:hypothetical protein
MTELNFIFLMIWVIIYFPSSQNMHQGEGWCRWRGNKGFQCPHPPLVIRQTGLTIPGKRGVGTQHLWTTRAIFAWTTEIASFGVRGPIGDRTPYLLICSQRCKRLRHWGSGCRWFPGGSLCAWNLFLRLSPTGLPVKLLLLSLSVGR